MSKVLSTPQLKVLLADDKQAAPGLDKSTIQLDGRHILKILFLHNDGPNYRCEALIKLTGRTDPLIVLLDCNMEQVNAYPDFGSH